MKKTIAIIAWTALLALGACTSTTESTTTTTETTRRTSATMDPSISNSRSTNVQPRGPR